MQQGRPRVIQCHYFGPTSPCFAVYKPGKSIKLFSFSKGRRHQWKTTAWFVHARWTFFEKSGVRMGVGLSQNFGIALMRFKNTSFDDVAVAFARWSEGPILDVQQWIDPRLSLDANMVNLFTRKNAYLSSRNQTCRVQRRASGEYRIDFAGHCRDSKLDIFQRSLVPSVFWKGRFFTFVGRSIGDQFGLSVARISKKNIEGFTMFEGPTSAKTTDYGLRVQEVEANCISLSHCSRKIFVIFDVRFQAL